MSLSRLTSEETGKFSTPVRKEMIDTAAHDLHRAARFHAGIRPLPWYIPESAISQVLRSNGAGRAARFTLAASPAGARVHPRSGASRP
jgi:hypothetical protein